MTLPHASTFPPILVLTSDTSGWAKHPSDISHAAITAMIDALRELGMQAEHIHVNPRTIYALLAAFQPTKYIVLNWCEGWGDNQNDYATPIQILETLGYTYTGSNATLVAQQKDETRDILVAARVSVAPALITCTTPVHDWTIFPAIVKPAHRHGSEGITTHSVVDTLNELNAQVASTVTQYRSPAFIEQFLTGIEYHVGVWGNGDEISVLPISTIDFSFIADYHQQLCTESTKWDMNNELYQQIWYGQTGWQIADNIPSHILQQLHHNAVTAYRALGLRDYARFDMRAHGDIVYVIDVNANPGIDNNCELPYMYMHYGYTYGQFIAQILSFALVRMPR